MIRLRQNWKRGDPYPGAEWFENVSRLLNGANIIGGQVFLNYSGLTICPDSATGTGSIDFAWCVTATGSGVTITPGDIELGPDTVIAWGYITGASTTLTMASGWVWVNIDMEHETAEMLSGSSVTALTETERKTILQKRIAYYDGTTVSRYQCGNIFIPRA